LSRGKVGCQDECAACPDECAACARIREIVKANGGCAANCECDDCPAGCQGCPCGEGAPCLCDAQASNIEVLRDMSAHLDMAAHALERRELYDRADQLREVATQLRQDARQTSVARAAKKAKGGSTQATRDVYTQLRMLQEELRRTREELEQARQQHFPPYR